MKKRRSIWSLKVSERGRQQISFNGGISGIGGSFFGLEYSTNNLLGRGEVLSFNLAAGNRQRSFQFSFTEPYIKDRPISAGFSLFAFSQKFFGEGTFLSQNLDAQEDLAGHSSTSTTSTTRTCSRETLTVARSSSARRSRSFTASDASRSFRAWVLRISSRFRA